MTTCTISPEDFEKAFRLECVHQASARGTVHPTINPFTHGDDFAVRYGPFLIDIAKRAGCSVHQARRRMRVLQDEGRVLRDDVDGGRTRWWLAGMSAELRPSAPQAPVTAPTPLRQTLTHVAVPSRQHWSDVLGVARDCSTSEAREAFEFALAQVNDLDLDAEMQRKRIRDAYNTRLTEDGISEYE